MRRHAHKRLKNVGGNQKFLHPFALFTSLIQDEEHATVSTMINAWRMREGYCSQFCLSVCVCVCVCRRSSASVQLATSIVLATLYLKLWELVYRLNSPRPSDWCLFYPHNYCSFEDIVLSNHSKKSAWAVVQHP